ncbi:MAG: MarR family transcriptional regulator [Roseitalea sp.]|jgi:DNA-binding MarR family transcriptional regulator|nr:MarR family transcriptional regulator [Roseitalea sp.]MBO6721529.1 MarR family transcriptional regulator [Roseitalea sp.]MBO6742086.1 MarR family transcriptional regulator [Roseitalea sp.]
MNSRVIAELIAHLGRIAGGDGQATGLTPVQWAALRYFTHANRFSRTPSGFAAFHGTTRGTASQVIKNLIARGYLVQTRSPDDGRSVRLDPTEMARTIASKDPMAALVEAADALPPGVRGAFATTLRQMQANVAAAKGGPVFGICRGCRYFEGDGCCRDELPPYACGFVDQPLVEDELEELCINYATNDGGTRARPDMGPA